jgi:surface protein
MKSSARRLLIAASLVTLGIACKEAIVEPVAVARIDVAGGGAGLRLGQLAQLSATLRSEEGWPLPGSGVTWTSSDASVATVSATGQVTALKRGTATVSASAGGVSGTAAVSVIGVQAVTIPQDTLAVVVQAQGTVTATVTADPGVSVPASWVARDTSVAQVDAAGRITARKLGTTWVVASAEVAADSVRVVVTPVPVTPPASGAAAPVTTSVLGGAVTLTIPPGATTAPALTVAPAPVAPADDRIPAGLAYVFGPAGSQFASPLTVSVAYDPAQILAAKRPLLRLHLVEGSTVTEVAGSAVDLANNRVTAPVTHFSTYAILVPSDPSQLAVTAGAGQTTFVEYEVPTAPSVTVRDAQGRPVARAKVSFDITAGGGRFRNGATQSSDTATTDANGVATLGAKWRLGSNAGANTLTIKAFTAAGSQAVLSTVIATAQTNPVARIVVTPDTATVQVGATRQLTATLYDARDTVLTGRAVTWASTDTSRATASATGLVTARDYTGPETRTVGIIGTSEGKADTTPVAIPPLPVVTVELSPTAATLAVGGTQQLTAAVKDAARNTLSSRVVTWSSSNSAVATVSSTGLVAAVTAGTAAITATSEGRTGTAEMTVTASSSGFSLASNGVTIQCPSASIGATGTVGGKEYTKRSRDQLLALIADAKFAQLTTSCTSGITDMSYLFAAATGFNQPVDSWDVSAVTTMRGMFSGASSFNQPLASWNVGSVTTMFAMFEEATAFNQPLASWNVSKVTDMQGMFRRASAFNQPIGGWNVSKVVDMTRMFDGATVFNQPIGTWNTSAVRFMSWMFAEASAFNQDISLWNLSNVIDISYLFAAATSFNQPVDSWDVSAVTTMRGMFSRASSFNRPVNAWNVGSVTTMFAMFEEATAFNQPLASWNVSKVTDMQSMFRLARVFNQDLSAWCVSSQPIAPAGFSESALSWTQPKPVWGTCPVASLTVSPATAVLSVGMTQQFTALLQSADGNTLTGRTVTWSSSAPSTLSVSSSGLATAMAAGTATITATSEGKQAVASVSVVPLAQGWVLRSSTGHQYRYFPEKVLWSEADSIARRYSTSTHAARLASLEDASELAFVRSYLDSLRIPFSGQEYGVWIGLYQDRTSSGYSEPAGGWRWVSGAMFDGTGWAQFEPNESGVEDWAMIGYGMHGGIGFSGYVDGRADRSVIKGYLVELVPVVHSVSVSSVSKVLAIGSSEQLTAVVKDGSGNVLPGRIVTWSSSDSAVAAVSSAGLVTAVASGSVTISATSEGKVGALVIRNYERPIVFQFAAGETEEDGNDIYAIRPDGSSSRVLLAHAGNDRHPVLSPDGSQISFVSNRHCAPCFWAYLELYTADTAGTNVRQLTTNMFSTYLSSWSSDGSQIVFQAQGGVFSAPPMRLYTVGAAGGALSQITSNFSEQPSWSTTDDAIAYSDGAGIVVMRSDGSGAVKVRNSGAAPKWSPDGQRILFQELQGIMVMNADGSNARVVVSSLSSYNDWPSWSPDGREIAFRSFRSGRAQVWVTGLDGSSLRQVTNFSSGIPSMISWWR